MEAISYGSVYVARVAMGGSDTHTVKAFREAEAYDGPSLIIAYSHCIAHGYDMAFGMEQQKAAVISGYWPLIRYNPALRLEGKNPFNSIPKRPDSAEAIYVSGSALYDARAKQSRSSEGTVELAQDDVDRQWRVYSNRAAMAGRTKRRTHPEDVEAPATPTCERGDEE